VRSFLVLFTFYGIISIIIIIILIVLSFSFKPYKDEEENHTQHEGKTEKEYECMARNMWNYTRFLYSLPTHMKIIHITKTTTVVQQLNDILWKVSWWWWWWSWWRDMCSEALLLLLLWDILLSFEESYCIYIYIYVTPPVSCALLGDHLTLKEMYSSCYDLFLQWTARSEDQGLCREKVEIEIYLLFTFNIWDSCAEPRAVHETTKSIMKVLLGPKAVIKLTWRLCL